MDIRIEFLRLGVRIVVSDNVEMYFTTEEIMYIYNKLKKKYGEKYENKESI
jgi:hypothetical protein